MLIVRMPRPYLNGHQKNGAFIRTPLLDIYAICGSAATAFRTSSTGYS